MSLTAHLLQRWLGAPLILHPDQLDSNPAPNVVVDVQLWLRNEVDMPVGWSLTSDSIAAGLAVHLDASELILLKSCTVTSGTASVQSLIEDGAVGDMCGIYYDRDGRIIKSGLENRMIAASVEQLQAADSLVAVACGEDKAVAVLGALRSGLISTLFIDQAMAERILAGLSVKKPRKT